MLADLLALIFCLYRSKIEWFRSIVLFIFANILLKALGDIGQHNMVQYIQDYFFSGLTQQLQIERKMTIGDV